MIRRWWRRDLLLPEISRPALLHVVRLALAALVLLLTLAGGEVLPVRVFDLAGPTAAYLLLTAFAELLRLRRPSPPARLVPGMLVVDLLYVTGVVALSGGPRSLLGFLVPLHLVAASLLLSHRTGLRLAVGYSLLLVGGHYLFVLQQPGTSSWGTATEASLAVTGFWAVALAVAVFSGLNERELTQARDQLRGLSSMTAELEQASRAAEMATILAGSVSAAFDVRRAAVVLCESPREGVVAWTGGPRGSARAASVRGANAVFAPRQAPELLARLDHHRDPALTNVFHGAVNVVVLPLTTDEAVVGVLAVECGGGDRTRIGAPALRMLEHFAAHAALAVSNARLMADLTRLAESDPLTGLANRRAFDQAFAREAARSARTFEPLTVIVLDIDHFKGVNDEHGHECGDDVLRHVGRRLADGARKMDVAARLGGEEFAVLLPDCGPAEGMDAAERLRAAIAAEAPLPVTASAGVATLGVNVDDASQLVGAADDALYEAKRTGRDRTCSSTRSVVEAALADPVIRHHPLTSPGPAATGPGRAPA